MDPVDRWMSAPRDILLLQLREHEEKLEALYDASRRRGRAIQTAHRTVRGRADQEADG